MVLSHYLYFSKGKLPIAEFIVSCLRTQASKGQSWDQSVREWISRDCLWSTASYADEEAQARRDFHELNM